MLDGKTSKRGRKSKKQIMLEQQILNEALVNNDENTKEKQSDDNPVEDNIILEKPKKKRGRKPKPKTEEDNIPKIPKKRGRKPKPKTEEEIDKQPKKRGRKPKEKTYSVVQSTYKDTLEEMENENIIVHIPITSADLQAEGHSMQVKDILKYSPNINEPLPYEPENTMQSNYAIISTQLQKKLKDLDEADEETDIDKNPGELSDEVIHPKTKESTNNDNINISTLNPNEHCGIESPNDHYIQSIKKTKTHEIMYEFINASDNNEWPTHTNISCFWCCHKFQNGPIGVPTRITRKKFNLWGCFCTYNCAASYILYNKIPNMWEKYALLNLFYSKVNNCKSVKIKLSPPRESLQMFGGNMTIDDFRRSSLKNNTIYRIIDPPIVSIIPQLEEIQLENMNRKKANTLLYNEYNQSGTSDSLLKLRREKPLSNKNYTLENYMHLKIV